MCESRHVHRALCRFELLETFVRLADAKFRKPKIAASLSEGVRMLLEQCVQPVLQPLNKWLDSNVFREELLYAYVHVWSQRALRCCFLFSPPGV